MMEPRRTETFKHHGSSMNELSQQGLQYLANVAAGGESRFSCILLYQTAIMGIERCLHGRFEKYGMTPAHHQGEGLLNELLVNGLLPVDLAEDLRGFMAHASVHDSTPDQLPWGEEEIRECARRFHAGLQALIEV